MFLKLFCRYYRPENVELLSIQRVPDECGGADSPVSLIGFSPLSDHSELLRAHNTSAAGIDPYASASAAGFDSVLELADLVDKTPVTKMLRTNPALKPLLHQGGETRNGTGGSVLKKAVLTHKTTSKASKKTTCKATQQSGPASGRGRGRPKGGTTITTITANALTNVTRKSPATITATSLMPCSMLPGGDYAPSVATDSESASSDLMQMPLPSPHEEARPEETDVFEVGDDLLRWFSTAWMDDFDRPVSPSPLPEAATAVIPASDPAAIIVDDTVGTAISVAAQVEVTAADTGRSKGIAVSSESRGVSKATTGGLITSLATGFLKPTYWTRPDDW